MTKGSKARLFSEYASYHNDPRNRACHALGIPLIVAGLLGLTAEIRIGSVNLAIVLAVLTLVYYVAIDRRGAFVALLVFAALYTIATRLQWQIDAALFVAGWVFQLVGHRIEGTKPKFLENLIYLLVGPLYIFEEGVDALARCF